MKQKEKLKWRRLDNSAKLFPLVGNKKFSSIYRMSVVLKETIQPKILKEAVISGVVTIRYIDRILFDWDKKGINTLEKLEKSQKKHKEKKNVDVEVPDYDWLNSNE